MAIRTCTQPAAEGAGVQHGLGSGESFRDDDDLCVCVCVCAFLCVRTGKKYQSTEQYQSLLRIESGERAGDVHRVNVGQELEREGSRGLLGRRVCVMRHVITVTATKNMTNRI